jgi:hypothetical protein
MKIKTKKALYVIKNRPNISDYFNMSEVHVEWHKTPKGTIFEVIDKSNGKYMVYDEELGRDTFIDENDAKVIEEN